MPPNTKLHQGWFVFYRQATKEYKKLCKANEPRWVLLKAYDDFINEASATFADCIKAYIDSTQFKQLATATQRNYLNAIATSENIEIAYTFGHMPPNDITPPDIQRFMDAWAVTPHKANTMLAVLTNIFNWNIARGHILIDNPCKTIKKYSSKQGGHYVSDADYFAFFDYLINNGYHAHAYAMALQYLCGARQQDVLRLLRNPPTNPDEKDSYLLERGIYIYQQKTGKRQVKLWNDDLLNIVQAALALRDSRYVICRKDGERYTRGGFNTIWNRQQRDAIEQGVISRRFGNHGMKRKAGSDIDGQSRRNFLGHKSTSISEIYNHTPDEVLSLKLPSKKHIKNGD